MTRPRNVPQALVDQAMLNVDRTHVLIAGVATYQELPILHGPSMDMEMVSQVFVDRSDISLFSPDKVIELENPTAREFSASIADYVQSRSARGDILILYFTGHGSILPDGSFGFCLADTRLSPDGNRILPITAVSIDHLVRTLAVQDVHPVFILDACFSSVTAPQGSTAAPSSIEETLRRSNAETFALLASSSSYSPSLDTPDGGAFTQALYSIVMNGISGDDGKYYPILTLEQLASPLQEELSRMGAPLSRAHIGRDFPILPISKNAGYEVQSETFTPYMREIVELIWNNGTVREAELSEFSKKIGQGAYANHSKLSLEPWQLLRDAGSNRIRTLTDRGKGFARGDLSIPRTIQRDPFSGEWRAGDGTEMVKIGEV